MVGEEHRDELSTAKKRELVIRTMLEAGEIGDIAFRPLVLEEDGWIAYKIIMRASFIPCVVCGGDGFVEWEKCEYCDGTGIITIE